MKEVYGINVEEFNLIIEKGYPSDLEECFFIWKDMMNIRHLGIGAYSEIKGNFTVNFGLGSKVINQDCVLAWININDIKVNMRYKE